MEFFGLLASFHAIFLRYPNRCSFYMQFTCTFTSFWFFFSSLLETYCVGDFQRSRIDTILHHCISFYTIWYSSMLYNSSHDSTVLPKSSVVSWRTKCHGSVSRAMNVAGAALALLMLAATVLRRLLLVSSIIIYIFLFAFSFLQFAFSMKSAFTTKLTQLYY
ncbi:hypothetical protein OSTOST_26003 [Ostertagia ostertagi]